MTLSERTYQALLIVYPSDHRRVYGDPMVQLFRDRMRRDGGGLRTLIVWVQISFDLVTSAFRERMETIMAIVNWTSRWWETSVVLLAVNAVVFGFLFAADGHPGWAFAVGFVPGVILFSGLAMRKGQRMGATILLTVGSVAASVPWWAIYTVVLALVIVVGGFWGGKIGPERAESVTVA